MPPSVSIAAIVLGAVLLLVAVLGGRFKIFGVEVTDKAGRVSRWLSGILGVALVAFSLFTLGDRQQPSSVTSAVPETTAARPLPVTPAVPSTTAAAKPALPVDTPKKPAPARAKLTQITPIVAGTVNVPVRDFVHYAVLVTETMHNPRLEGSFTARGGFDNLISVFVMDEAGFNSWKEKRDEGKTFYRQRLVRRGDISVELPSLKRARYYLVYDNTESPVFSRSVATRVDLIYKQ